MIRVESTVLVAKTGGRYADGDDIPIGGGRPIVFGCGGIAGGRADLRAGVSIFLCQPSIRPEGVRER